jgi:thiol-disulfide isomerase/thioredoxin
MAERLLLLAALTAIAAALWWVAARRRRPAPTPATGVNGWTLIYFWGPHCAACAALKRTLEVLMQENDQWLQLRTVHAINERDEASRWGVWTVPTIFLVDDMGRTAYWQSGAVSPAELRRVLAVHQPESVHTEGAPHG